jgi:hypothetical protein
MIYANLHFKNMPFPQIYHRSKGEVTNAHLHSGIMPFVQLKTPGPVFDHLTVRTLKECGIK